MKTAPLDVNAIIEELRTTGQSKMSLPQPVDKFCKALKRIDRAVEPDSLVCEARPGDSTMVLRTKKVTP